MNPSKSRSLIREGGNASRNCLKVGWHIGRSARRRNGQYGTKIGFVWKRQFFFCFNFLSKKWTCFPSELSKVAKACLRLKPESMFFHSSPVPESSRNYFVEKLL
jgi:hypothetical protein